LSEIDRKLQALPGEIDALKRRGAEEIAAEEKRIAAVAAAERDRLLEQTRREIELQVRLAKRALVEHAADLSVQLAAERIKKTMTPEDQERIVDRYLDQVKGH
jgi:F0F1-type ATP synthase membrane subunit b/b'